MKLFGSGSKLHPLKNLYLRLRYGAGCCDTYSYCWWASKRLAKELRVFKTNNNHSYPINLKDMEEWRKILDEIIWSLEYINKEDTTEEDHKQMIKNNKRCNRGMRLFGKYFRDLWY